MSHIPYRIGAKYKYPNSTQVFTLVEVRPKWVFRFECGHWCTDSVFVDLFDIEKRRQVYEMIPAKQLVLDEFV